MAVTRNRTPTFYFSHGVPGAMPADPFASRQVRLLSGYAASQLSFDRWFKDQVLLVTGSARPPRVSSNALE
jgi:hypothetical protein